MREILTAYPLITVFLIGFACTVIGFALALWIARIERETDALIERVNADEARRRRMRKPGPLPTCTPPSH